MSNGVRQMPGHVEAAYKEVVNNIFFMKRQQWVTTNYTILVYAAIFIISARFFTRTDLARGWLGLLTFLTFFYHLYMIKLFQDAITSFRDRLAWIYRTYFSADEQAGLNLSLRPDPYWHQAAVPLGLIGVSMVGAVLTLIYLFSVRWAHSPARDGAGLAIVGGSRTTQTWVGMQPIEAEKVQHEIDKGQAPCFGQRPRRLQSAVW
jgi:hypothetical protein